MPAEMDHAGLEGDPGSGRALLEDHAEGLAVEQPVRFTALLLRLEIPGQSEERLEIGATPVTEAEKIHFHEVCFLT